MGIVMYANENNGYLPPKVSEYSNYTLTKGDVGTNELYDTAGLGLLISGGYISDPRVFYDPAPFGDDKALWNGQYGWNHNSPNIQDPNATWMNYNFMNVWRYAAGSTHASFAQSNDPTEVVKPIHLKDVPPGDVLVSDWYESLGHTAHQGGWNVLRADNAVEFVHNYGVDNQYEIDYAAHGPIAEQAYWYYFCGEALPWSGP
jgi:hypothetical protein